jgi:mono/diheme cytochrome c family protein
MKRSFAYLPLLFTGIAHANPAPDFDKDLKPFLEQHCIRCHGEKKQKGDFRIDTLSKDIGTKDTPQWFEVLQNISTGDMPPEDEKVRPTAEEGASIVRWIAARVKEGEAARMARRDRVSYHRLTREEYVNSVRDLIGVEYDASDPGGLLEDPEWNGFERIGSVLTLSPTHIEKYMKAAEIVLDEAYPEKPIEYLEASVPAATVREGRPYYEEYKEQGLLDKVRYLMVTSGEQYRYSNPYRDGLKFPGPGIYEISYKLSGLKPENKPAPRLQVYEHKLDRILFEQDIIAPEDQPTTITFRTHFPDVRGPNIHVLNLTGPPRHPVSTATSNIPFINLQRRRAPWQVKVTDQEGNPRYPMLILDSITFKGPIVTELEKQRRDAYMAKEETLEAATQGLATMARNAFRRPLYVGELDTYTNIVKSELEAGEKFKDAVKSAMTAILCSKSFLFLSEGNEDAERHTLNDWEIASRLSYLLWSTMPDDELFGLAEKGKLQDKAVLNQQFQRLLADSRADRFKDSFSKQWLNLRKVGMFAPDRKIYPNYDDHLENSMVGESQAFFGEVLDSGGTLREFIDSDWTMLNPKLAGFYNIPGITEDKFQRVSLKPGDHRGGILTQASILSLTSDGTRHRPVHRGVWLKEVIYGKTPPPPPANVDPIEPTPPDSPKATLRQKLDAHKADPNCSACHAKIDPFGLSFDNYNAIGEWRTHEKGEGTGDDPPVDPSGQLPDGRKFANAEDFKKLVLDDLEKFNRAFVEKLAIYGMRRTLTLDDHEDLDKIAKAGSERDYVVKDIIEDFVLSDLFKKR